MTAPARAAEAVADAAQRFHALSDPTRLAILAELRSGEQCVCDLVDRLGVAQSLLSFHLRTLKAAGFVTDRREGRWSYYTLEADALEATAAALDRLRPARRTLRVRSTCD